MTVHDVHERSIVLGRFVLFSSDEGRIIIVCIEVSDKLLRLMK
ncbi:hypothetical protein SAMN04488023_15813 [Pedobacter rhizosphaerae]|uniref:Uncharacterized protein n=1 Tax=Pedobacter rhizosphaerae TaxID=390241 RepID=A0A1H9W4D0_9SPHI|nr:hypothetical protein SAMN04488023_15813 [Pedobacter rhizosphaerae]